MERRRSFERQAVEPGLSSSRSMTSVARDSVCVTRCCGAGEMSGGSRQRRRGAQQGGTGLAPSMSLAAEQHHLQLDSSTRHALKLPGRRFLSARLPAPSVSSTTTASRRPTSSIPLTA